MKSKLKLSYVFLNYIFSSIIVLGLTGGMYYDLGPNFTLAWHIIFILILVLYPLFCLVTYLSIPRITITDKELASVSLFSKKSLLLEECKSAEKPEQVNKLYARVGKQYVFSDKRGTRISIPHNIFSNEQELLDLLNSRLNSISEAELRFSSMEQERHLLK